MFGPTQGTVTLMSADFGGGGAVALIQGVFYCR